MAKYEAEVTLKVKFEFNPDEHTDDLEENDLDPDNEQDVREFINEKLGEDVTEFGDPEVEKIELKKIADK